MMIELIKKNKKYIKETLLLFLGGIIINLACFFMCFLTGHCANQQTFNPSDFIIPYSVPDMLSFNPSFDTSAFKNQWENNIGPMMMNWYGGQISTSDYIVSIGEYDQNNNRWFINIVCHPSIASGINIDHNFSQEIQVGGYWFGFTVSASDYSYIGNLSAGSNGHFFLGDHSTINIGNITYLANYPVLLSGNDLYSGDTLVFTNESLGGNINVGDFVDLPNIDEILNNISNTWEPPSSITGHALPNQPTENPNNNDFENRLQMFDYLKNSINAIVGNLGYNLKNWFDNLKGKMVQGFNSVSNNIWNGFKTLMDNISGFFGPKIDTTIDKFNYITEPFDSQKLSENLNNANFSSDFLGLITTFSTFGTAFTSGSVPNSCSFSLDFTNSYYNFGVCEFSLDWILPFRSIIRLIIGCLCVYSLIISIFTSLNTYIGGTSSINDDI